MELLKRFKQGDLEAFEALFRQFQAEVYGWILRIVRDPAAAEDLTVETFWRIYRARGRFDPGVSRSTIFAACVRKWSFQTIWRNPPRQTRSFAARRVTRSPLRFDACH